MHIVKHSSPNLALSGWAGVGTSSLTMILSVLLKRNYYNLGNVFRDIDAHLTSIGDKALTAKFEQEVQPIVGHTLDKYADYLLTEGNNVIFESDIAAFRVGKNPKLYSIFITANQEKRLERFITDGRESTETVLEQRDEVLRQEYIKLWNIDIFNLELINRKYYLVLDNSELSIEDELLIIIRELQEQPGFKEAYDWGKIESKINKEVAEFWKKGKSEYKQKLIDKDLMVSVNKIYKQITSTFPEEISAYPDYIKKIFMDGSY